jgi:hypothetical protein
MHSYEKVAQSKFLLGDAKEETEDPGSSIFFRRFCQTIKTGNCRMLTIHIVQTRLGYGIDYIKFEDEEGLVVYLLTRGVTEENIMKALEGLGREGAYTIQQE